MTETAQLTVGIAGRRFSLARHDVEQAMRGLEPEPVASHFVVVAERRYPPKQVISAVTGLDRADFTTHQARRTLMRLGFVAGRRGAVTAMSSPRSAVSTGGEALRPFVGQWVAVIDGDVAHAAKTPQELVAWLSRHGQKADSVFRVPEDELATSGLAPL